MKGPTKIILATWALTAAWLGCNAILGNESAEFVAPDAGPAPTVTVTTPAPPPLPPPPPPPIDAGPCDGAVLASDPANCGACGHDCLGGACSNGACEPVVVAVDALGAKALAIDDAHVYWTNDATHSVMRAPLAMDAGPVETLYKGPVGSSLGPKLAVYGGSVYFTVFDSDGGVYRCPATGCGDAGPEAVVAHVDTPKGMTIVDAGQLVFAATGGGHVGRCTLPACANVDLIDDFLPEFATVSADGVAYWTTTTNGVRTNDGDPDAAPVTLSSVGFCADLVATPTHLIVACPGSGPLLVPRDGGGGVRLYDAGTVQSSYVVTDGVYAYASNYLSGVGGILRCPLDGGCTDAGAYIVKNQNNPSGLVLDAKSVLWANAGDTQSGSTIMRLAK